MTETHPTPRKPQSAPLLPPDQFEALRDIISHYSGVYLDQANQRTLSNTLAARLANKGMTFDAYLAHLKQPDGRGELHQFAENLLNHETIFFRNQSHMRALREVILPRLHRSKPPRAPLRIWSAGCSTGEEPYSLAITALETLGQILPRPVEILATDLSDLALEKARNGTYRGRTLSNVSPALRHRYFQLYQDSWSVCSKVRDLVTFEQYNLLDPFPPRARNCDIIFCQNVTIYFQLETFRSLVDRFYHVLPEGGLLFLGFSETLWNIYDKFRLREIADAFVYVKETSLPRAAPPPAESGTQPDQQHTAVKQSSSPTDQQTPAAPRITTPLPRITTPLEPAEPVATSGSEPEFLKQGRALLEAGQVDEVLELLYKVPLNGPHAPNTLALIAKAHANRGDPDLAIAEARRAIDLNWRTTEAYLLLGVLYAQVRQFSAAIQQLERARYLDPDSALISFHLAEIYRQADRSGPAAREYRNTLRKLSTCSPDMLLDGVVVGWLRDTCERYLKLLQA